MTEPTVNALLHNPRSWHLLNWSKAHRSVSQLQARIVKATKLGKWRIVRNLQRLLTHSLSAKALAVKKVTENRGKKTPGVDRVTWDTPEAKSEAVRNLKQSGYKAKPLRRIYIPKAKGKRPLGIPTMHDRAVQALHLLALDPIAQTNADLNSYGFRKERSCADAIGQCYNLLAKKGSGQWILEGDIRACFDQIDHSWLETHVPMDKGILHQWLKVGYVEEKTLFPTEEGTPQGGIASPCLANLALDGIESLLHTRFHPTREESRRNKVYCVRYADDFIITSTSREVLQEEVKSVVEEFLQIRGLELSEQKTRIVHISEGFDFLGQNIRKYNGKLLIKPSQKSQKALMQKVKGVLDSHKGARQDVVINKLNPILRGWANYHRHVVSKQVFDRLDRKIWQGLWRWAQRRHPNKGDHWLLARYFKRKKGRDRFSTESQDEKGHKFDLTLYHLAETPIERHVQIQAQRNPYDPEDEDYFKQRRKTKMKKKLAKHRTKSAVYREQEGLCAGCKQPLLAEEELDLHHLLERQHGGSDIMENLSLMHLNCHRQIHARKTPKVAGSPTTGALFNA